MSEKLETELKASLEDGKLPCSVGLGVARKLKVVPKDVGDVANSLEIRIVNCQLGCFGMKKGDA